MALSGAMGSDHVALLTQARWAVGAASQGEFGEMLGVSRRTGQRWMRGHSTPTPTELQRMAALVYPRDADLAEQLAQAAGASLVALGLVKPSPPQAPPAAPAPPLPVEDVIEAVVCAAADAMDESPRRVRPALLAALQRARRMGLTVEAMEEALRGDGDGEAKTGAARARKAGA